jgi:hypothetical protein
MIRVGFDISKTSPAVSWVHPDTGHLTVHCVQNIQRNQTFSNNNFSLFVHPPLSGRQSCCDWLCSLQLPPPNQCRVAIEGHAFAATHTNNSSHVIEIVGALKHCLHRNGYQWVVFPPTKVKKAWTGSGRSNKKQMYDEWIKRGYPDIHSMWNPRARNIQKPVEDIVDATAVAFTLSPDDVS